MVVTSAANDTLMNKANTEIVPVSHVYSSPTFSAFSAVVHSFGRFFLTDWIPVWPSNVGQTAGGEYWASQNPFSHTPTLFWALNYSEKVEIRSIDLAGKEVYHSEQMLEAGRHSLTLPIDLFLHPGVYVLQVTGRHSVFLQKVTKI